MLNFKSKETGCSPYNEDIKYTNIRIFFILCLKKLNLNQNFIIYLKPKLLKCITMSHKTTKRFTNSIRKLIFSSPKSIQILKKSFATGIVFSVVIKKS